MAHCHCAAGGMTSRCQMYSPSTSKIFLAPHSAARSTNILQRSTWNARTGSLKSIKPVATTTQETIGRLDFSQVHATSSFSFLEIVIASVKISTQSKPMRAMCLRPVAVSTPAWPGARGGGPGGRGGGGRAGGRGGGGGGKRDRAGGGR